MKSLKNIYIFIGPPGSGKGSLSHLCKKNFGWAHLSTGNLCRQHIAHQTEIGQQIDQIIKMGKLIDDELMIKMVAAWIDEVAQTAQGIILDGFPRTTAQARALDALFAENRFADAGVTVVTMNIHDDRVINRLRTRYVCQREGCQAIYSCVTGQCPTDMKCQECGASIVQRADDSDNVVHERLKTYHHYADDLLNYYRGSYRKIIDLNVEEPLDTVFQSFVGQLA